MKAVSIVQAKFYTENFCPAIADKRIAGVEFAKQLWFLFETISNGIKCWLCYCLKGNAAEQNKQKYFNTFIHSAKIGILDQEPGCKIQEPGFQMLDLRCWIQEPVGKNQDVRFKNQDFRCQMLDSRAGGKNQDV